MAVVHKATASAEGGNDATVTIPASVVAGDLLVVHTSNKNTLGPLDVPTGWTLIEEITGGLTLSVAYKIANSTDAGSDVLFMQQSSTANAAAIIDVFTGHDPVFPIGVHASGDVGVVTNPQTPSVDAELPGLLLCGTAQEVAAQATAATPPLTLANDEPNSARTITVTTGYDQVGVGATGSREFTRGTSAKSKVSSMTVNASGSSDGFPTVVGRDECSDLSDTLVFPIPLGSPGDLLVVTTASHGDMADVQDPGGFSFVAIGAKRNGHIGTRIADGTEGTTIAVQFNNVNNAGLIWRISNWFEYGVGGLVEDLATSAPDPGLYTPSWGEADVLWIAVANGDTVSVEPTAYPADYILGRYSSAGLGTNNPLAAGAERNLRASFENPGAFSIDSAQWGSGVIAVSGIAAVIGGGFEGFGAVNI